MKVQYLQLKYFKLDVKAENLVGQMLKEEKNWEIFPKKRRTGAFIIRAMKVEQAQLKEA